MKIKRYGFFYSLFSFGKFFPFSPIPKDRRKWTSLDEYMRVMTMGVIYHAYLTLLTWIPAVVLTFAANIITVPFGFGFSVLYPRQQFIAKPFEFPWRGTHHSWSRILVPLWIIVGNFGLILTNNPIKKLDLIIVLSMDGVAAAGYMLAIIIAHSRAYKIHTIEFID